MYERHNCSGFDREDNKDMKPLLFTFPGKIGDNLLRLPVTYQYCRQNFCKADICLDSNSKILVDLFKKQKWVNDVFLDDGVWDYSYGGQPYDFRKDEEFKRLYDKVFHLGFIANCYGQKHDFSNDYEFRNKYTSIQTAADGMPLLNTTLISAIQSGCAIDLRNLLTEPSIHFEPRPLKNLCIHINTATPERKLESKAAILSIYDRLIDIFDKIYIIGPENDRQDNADFLNNPKTSILDDRGDLNKTVDALSESMLIGTYGSMWALANCMKIKQVVIMNNWDKHDGKSSYYEDRWVMPENLLKTVLELKG